MAAGITLLGRKQEECSASARVQAMREDLWGCPSGWLFPPRGCPRPVTAAVPQAPTVALVCGPHGDPGATAVGVPVYRQGLAQRGPVSWAARTRMPGPGELERTL